IELAWELSIEATNRTEWYNLRVNAINGQIINKGNWINSCNFGHTHDDAKDKEIWHFHKNTPVPHTKAEENQNILLTVAYLVFARQLESLFFGDRMLVSADDAVNLVASPYGWHDNNGAPGNEYTTTRGNNVNAYEDGDNSGFQPNPGSGMMFDYPFDMNYSSST